MATRLQLRALAAAEVMPNAKQSADTINRDVAASVATYANPAKMLVAAGAGTSENSSTAAEPGAAHYTHYGSWISDTLAAQTISGTVIIALVMAEGNTAANASPRVKIYKWLASDAFGSDILALTTSATEVPAAFPASPVSYFGSKGIVTTEFAAGDRIVIEIETYDNNTKTASYLHGIRFDGADTGGYGGYIEFTADISWLGGQTSYQSLPATAIGSSTLSRLNSFYRTLSPSATGLAGLNKGMYLALAVTAIGSVILTPAAIFSRALAATAQGVASLTKVTTYVKALNAIALGVAALTKISTYSRVLSVTAIGVSSLSKIATHYVSLAASAVGSAVLTTAQGLVYTKTLAAIAIGISALTKVVWTVEALVEAYRTYCEAWTGTTIDTRRDITNEADQAQIIADMKVAYPASTAYYRHPHKHDEGANQPCVLEEV